MRDLFNELMIARREALALAEIVLTGAALVALVAWGPSLMLWVTR